MQFYFFEHFYLNSPLMGACNLQIRSYYGVSRNLLIRFKDDTIDETSILAQVLASDSAISSLLDMSIRLLPGDHGLPLQQVNSVPKRFCQYFSDLKRYVSESPSQRDAI